MNKASVEVYGKKCFRQNLFKWRDANEKTDSSNAYAGGNW